MAVIGGIGGLLFLAKQTAVLATFVAFAILLLLLFASKFEKKPVRTFLMLLLGVVVALTPFFVYMFKTQSLEVFIYQVYVDVDSKGGLYHIIVDKLVAYILDKEQLGFSLLVVGFFLAWLAERKERRTAAIITFAITCFLCGYKYKDLVQRMAEIFKLHSGVFIRDIYESGVIDFVANCVNHMLVFITCAPVKLYQGSGINH